MTGVVFMKFCYKQTIGVCFNKRKKIRPSNCNIIAIVIFSNSLIFDVIEPDRHQHSSKEFYSPLHLQPSSDVAASPPFTRLLHQRFIRTCVPVLHTVATIIPKAQSTWTTSTLSHRSFQAPTSTSQSDSPS